MTILSRAEIESPKGDVGDLTETCLAMHAALEAWAKWALSPDGMAGDLFVRALELTADAGVWPEEEENEE